MKWSPISQSDVEQLIERDLRECHVSEREFFYRVRAPLSKWALSPYGDMGGGFWVVAVSGEHVLWYNDIEDGFNVSAFKTTGTIPPDQYWCNQDELRIALLRFGRGEVGGAGPPQPSVRS